MSTPFTDIYSLNEIIRNDNRLSLKPTNQIYQLYYKYLQYAIAYFFRDCYVDLKDNVSNSQNEFMFIANGTDNQFQLSSQLLNSAFYVGVAKDKDTVYTEVDSSNYTFDILTNVLTITSSLITAGYVVYISNYVIGQFNLNLDYDEKIILSEAMNIPFLEEQQNRNSLLTQMVYGGESKIYSQANHINSVHTTVEDQIIKVKRMIKEYSYRASPDSLKKLGGSS